MDDRPRETLHGAVVVARRPDGVAVVDRLPDGWRHTGCFAKWEGRHVEWVGNGKSRFTKPKAYEHALMLR